MKLAGRMTESKTSQGISDNKKAWRSGCSMFWWNVLHHLFIYFFHLFPVILLQVLPGYTLCIIGKKWYSKKPKGSPLYQYFYTYSVHCLVSPPSPHPWTWKGKGCAVQSERLFNSQISPGHGTSCCTLGIPLESPRWIKQCTNFWFHNVFWLMVEELLNIDFFFQLKYI